MESAPAGVIYLSMSWLLDVFGTVSDGVVLTVCRGLCAPDAASRSLDVGGEHIRAVVRVVFECPST